MTGFTDHPTRRALLRSMVGGSLVFPAILSELLAAEERRFALDALPGAVERGAWSVERDPSGGEASREGGGVGDVAAPAPHAPRPTLHAERSER